MWFRLNPVAQKLAVEPVAYQFRLTGFFGTPLGRYAANQSFPKASSTDTA
jgi:hypothetical protein